MSLVFLDDLLGIISRHLERPAAASEYIEWLQQRTDPIPLNDTVTGLPGARLLRERLRHSLAYTKRYNARPAVTFIAMPGFLTLKAAHRQRVEEELLKEIVRRLGSHKRERDTLARLRFDEFALLFKTY